jgi:hypothetical protein
MDSKTTKLCIAALLSERARFHEGLVVSNEAHGMAKGSWLAREEFGQWIVESSIAKGDGWLFTKEKKRERDAALSSYESTIEGMRKKIAELDRAILN